MKGLKTTLVPILAVGLLAGSTVAVAAQEDAADELLFAIVDTPSAGIGEFTGYGDIPAGTTLRDEFQWDPPNMSGTNVVDPGEPGGDTFTIQMSGQVRGTLDSGAFHSVLFWSIRPGSGTGEYADLTGKGKAFGVTNVDDGWGSSVFMGSMGSTEE